MDPDEIVRLVQAIRSSSPSDCPIRLAAEDLSEGANRVGKLLVAKILSQKKINPEVVKSQLPHTLQFLKKVDIVALGDNLFLLHFASGMDRASALHEGPWYFFQDLIIFKQPPVFESFHSMKFNCASFWIQLHNLPFGLSSEKIIKKLVSQIGFVEELDGGDSGSFLGSFARLKVSIDIHKPLKQYLRISLEDIVGEVIIVLIQYEKLPDFCYGCGVIGHTVPICDQGVDFSEDGQIFGPWMRAKHSSSSSTLQIMEDDDELAFSESDSYSRSSIERGIANPQ